MPDHAPPDEARITLYRLHGCPYCERVVRKLRDYDLPYHSRFVEAEHSARTIAKRIGGTRMVPLLVDRHTGVTMAESANIVAYLDRQYGPEA